MEDLRRTLRVTLRRLRKSPGFTVAAVITLALGIGANTAIFSVVTGVLLRPLDFHAPEELVSIWVAPDEPGGGAGNMSFPDAADLAESSDSFRSLVAYSPGTATLTDAGEAAVEEVARVSNGLLAIFLETPLLGRDVQAHEWGPDGARVAVIGHGLWQQRFGGDPAVIGRTFRLNDVPYEIVGVAPAGFDFPRNTRIWLPRILDPESCGRGCHTWRVVARMAPEVTPEAARTDVDRIAAALRESHPETNADKSFLVRSLIDDAVGDVKRGLWLLLGAVGLVLLIACANVAGLFLVRSIARGREVAVRAALGANRRHLGLEILGESFVLAAMGGAAGLLVAHGAVAGLRRWGAAVIPRIEGVVVDVPVLLFGGGLVLAVTVLCGLAPLWHLRRSAPATGLGIGGGAAEGGRHAGRFRRTLLAAEVALSLMLLVGAGLLLRTFGELRQVPLGFEPEGMVRFQVTAPSARYGTLEEQRTFFRTLESRLASLPGVDTVGSAFAPPMGRGRATGGVRVEGALEPAPGREALSELNPVSPGWFETYGIRILSGRFLRPEDDRGEGPAPAVVNRTFAERFLSGEDPVGRIVTVGVNFGWGQPPMEIVGVVEDIRNEALVDPAEPQVYPAHGRYGRSSLNVALRVRPGVDPLGLVPSVRDELRRLDPEIPIFQVETVESAIGREVAPTRLYTALVGLFALVAVALAAVGLYGVVAYAVFTRKREIGVRMVLGADGRRVVRAAMREGLTPTGLGLVLGIAGALATSRVMEALVYGVRPTDPWVLAGAAAVLGLVALLAAFVPARRAAAVEPATTLRAE